MLDGPNYYNLDMTLAKLFSAGHIKGEFRADVFNLPNTPHFNNPGSSFGSATFGQINGSFGERSMRFGFKLTF